MGNAKPKLTDQELSNRAKEYVLANVRNAGGYRQLACALRLKTLPFWLGVGSHLSFSRFVRSLLRVALFVVSAMVPFLLRKLADSGAASIPESGRIAWALSELNHTDILLGLVVAMVPMVIRYLDVLDKEKPAHGKHHPPYIGLCSALDKMPSFPNLSTERRSVSPQDETIRFALQGLQAELSQLIGDDSNTLVVDVSFLEFLDERGSQMRVRVRTTTHEETGRPIPSSKLMAFYVARTGRWFVEHDFLGKQNPFPPYRLSVLGDHKIEYRSVLFLPIIQSVVTDEPESGQGTNETRKRSQDKCLGVICAHSPKPYRFWRMGDHKKEMAGFGNVAYQRSLPYITLVRRLLEQTANKVPLEDL